MADAYQLKAILSAVDKLTPVLKTVQAQTQIARKYIGDLGSSVNGLASKFGIGAGLFAGIAAGFGIGAIKKAVVSYAELGEEVIKGAYKAGMSTDQYQRMKYVAEQAGVQMDVLGLSMGKLNKNIGTAAMGKNQALVDLFRQLKVPLRDANGQLRNASDMLPQLAQAFVMNQDPVKQAALGTALFGKAYQEMLPFLNEGSEGIEQSLARFAKLKGVIGNEDLKGAKDFGDKLADLNVVTKGFQMTVARELVPVLGPLVDKFVLWFAANKKIIGQNVKGVVQDLVAAIKQVDWQKWLDGVRSTAASIGAFIDRVGGLRNLLIGLAIVMNASTIMAFIGLTGAVGRLGLVVGGGLLTGLTALFNILRTGQIVMFGMSLTLGGVALAAAPFLIAAAAIAGAAYLVWRNWDVVAPALAAVWERIKTVATVAWNVLRFLFSWSPVGVVVNNWGAISGWLGAFWEGLKGIVSSGISAVGTQLESWGVLDAVKAVWDPVVDFFKGVWNVIGKIIGPVIEAAGAAGRAIGGFVDDRFGEGANNVAYGPRFDGPSPGLGSAAPLALNGPAQATLNGKVDISFKDAPPGMRVEQAQTNGSRVALNTDVGYRWTAAMGY